jgi:hypothetical protein
MSTRPGGRTSGVQPRATDPLEVGSPAAVEEYFAALSAAFCEAADATGLRQSTLTVGRWAVDLQFAGRALRDVTIPALAFTSEEAASDPLATICLFDSASTGVPVPPFAWRPQHIRERGAIQGFNNDRFRTVYHGDPLAPDGGFNALSMFDAATRTTVVWVESVEQVHWWERAEPLRTALYWALNGEDRYLAHAAAVGDDTGAVLLAGPGGAGKTTTTVACLRDGMTFVGDNYVLVSLDDEPVAHAIYSNLKLRDGTLELLPGLGDAPADREEGEKLVIDVGRTWPSQLAASLPLRAIAVVCLRTEAATRAVPASAVEVLLALAPTTVYQLPDNGRVLRSMAELVRGTRSFRVELGADVLDTPATIRALLDASGC